MPENNETVEESPKITPPESGAEFNEVEDVIYRRRSVRFYKKKQVPEYLVRRILEAGRFAPSAGNGQTWKFIVVRDQKMIEEMAEDIINVTKRVKKFADYIEPGNERKEWRARLLQRRMPNMFHPIPFGAMKFMADHRTEHGPCRPQLRAGHLLGELRHAPEHDREMEKATGHTLPLQAVDLRCHWISPGRAGRIRQAGDPGH
jgi:nitroreductase